MATIGSVVDDFEIFIKEQQRQQEIIRNIESNIKRDQDEINSNIVKYSVSELEKINQRMMDNIKVLKNLLTYNQDIKKIIDKMMEKNIIFEMKKLNMDEDTKSRLLSVETGLNLLLQKL